MHALHSVARRSVGRSQAGLRVYRFDLKAPRQDSSGGTSLSPTAFQTFTNA